MKLYFNSQTKKYIDTNKHHSVAADEKNIEFKLIKKNIEQR